jgi:hypothetical protein
MAKAHPNAERDHRAESGECYLIHFERTPSECGRYGSEREAAEGADLKP